MHDGLEVEKRGIPAVVVCTEEFESTGKAITEMRGAAGYPFVLVPHPIGVLDEATLKQRAKDALPQVVNLLLTQGEMQNGQ